MSAKPAPNQRVYATLTVEVWFQAEVEELAQSTANWGDWNLVTVGPIRRPEA